MNAKFGPAGNSLSFTAMGYKSSLDLPAYLTEMGLDVFEYQCGRGVHIGEEKARQIGGLFKEQGFVMTLHAPYYINLSALEEQKRRNSVGYILESARAVDWFGGDRIVVHPGSLMGRPREEALALACETLREALRALDEEGLSHIRICPETMGKINQLGNLREVLELCGLDERLIPCIDFGHLNARTHGGLDSKEAFRRVFDEIENALGLSRLREFHSHFSKIEYTAGGEKRHLTFEDETFGPDYEPVMELTVEKGCGPVFICESAGTQAEDAKAMKDCYDRLAAAEYMNEQER